MSAEYLKAAEIYDGRYHITIVNEDQLSNFQKVKARPPATLSNPINTHTSNVLEQMIAKRRGRTHRTTT